VFRNLFTGSLAQRIVCISLVLVAGLSLVACGDSGASQEELSQAKRAGAAHAREQARIKQIQREIRKLRHGGGESTTAGVPSGSSSGSTSGGSSSCGGELSVGANTTCPFAENVEASYFNEIGSGSGTVIAYSPVTGKTYSMYCTAGTPHVCTGGDDASVYFP
jgi:hypothetical protein